MVILFYRLMRLQFKRFNYSQLFRLSPLNRNNRLGLTPVAKRVSGTWPGCRLHFRKRNMCSRSLLSGPPVHPSDPELRRWHVPWS